jgi:hypothetical protein
MKTEEDVRKMLTIIKIFGHPEGVKALQWVLDEYSPPRNVEPSVRDGGQMYVEEILAHQQTIRRLEGELEAAKRQQPMSGPPAPDLADTPEFKQKEGTQ